MIHKHFITFFLFIGLAVPLLAAPPVIDNNGGATNIGRGVATLTGNLSGDTADVMVYWGTSDEGMNAGSWEHAEALGTLAVGSFSTNLNGLLYGLPYYYRVYASNGMGTAWAGSTETFKTLIPRGPRPDDFSGLEAWYNASTIGSNHNDIVGNWPDDSGNNYDMGNVGGSGNDPKLQADSLNGLPVVRYDGNDYQYTAHNFSGLNDYSIFSVARYTSTNFGIASRRVVTSRGGNWLFGMHSALDERWFVNAWVHDAGAANTNWHVYVGTMTDDPLTAFWKDGNLLTTNDTDAVAPYAPVQLAFGGRNSPTDHSSKAEIAEVIIYNRILTGSEILDASAYLAEKYNLPTAMPVSFFSELAIEGNPVTNLLGRSAFLNAQVGGEGSVFDVTAYYGLTDEGTNALAWDQSIAMGSYTNLDSTNINVFISGLIPQTSYAYTFKLENCSTSIWVEPSLSFTTPVGSPVVTNGSAANVTVKSADASGMVLANGGEDPAVTIYYGRVDAGASFGWESSLDLGIQSGSFTGNLTGLAHNTNYYFRVYAANSGGGSWSPVSSSFMTLLAFLPAVQTDPPANIGINTALFRGQVTEVGDDPPEATFYYGRVNEGVNTSAWENSQSVGTQTGAFSRLVGGLEADTRYYVRAEVQNVAGSSWATNTYSFLTQTSPALSVVINEIHYDPDLNTSPSEFIEIYNPGTQALDLTGWALTKGVDYIFPAGSMINGGQYLIIAQDSNEFLNVFGFPPFGQWEVGDRLANENETVTLRDGGGDKVDEVDYGLAFPWPTASQGEGSSMELIHPTIDNDLGGAWRSSSGGPTPGAQNSVFSINIPPRLRQVKHSPDMPAAGVGATITVKATDPDGIQSVKLIYQVVQPGSYVSSFLAFSTAALLANPTNPLLPNPAFENPANWTEVPMVDDGTGDDTYTYTLPGQVNRALVRYRIEAADTLGDTVLVPYADDPSLNFAFYTYNGVPAYTVETRTVQAAGLPYTYPTNIMRSIPTYTLITDEDDFDQCIAYDTADRIGDRNNYAARSAFNWTGTFVYEGVVYDHIGYRLRQRNARYSGSSKRSMRFRFNRGYYAQFRDVEGKKYPTKWRTLNTQKCRGSRGTLNFGLPEISAAILWELFKVPAPRAHWMHFRVVKGTDEAPAGVNGQHFGDFFGYYQAMEDYDKPFLDARNMEPGNLYKLKSGILEGTEIQRYQAPNAVDDGSDYENIIFNLRAARSDAWLDQHVDYAHWNRYHAVIEGVRSFDVAPNTGEHLKNRAFYFKPAPGAPLGLLQTLPWDADTSWGPNWNQGRDFPKVSIFEPERPAYTKRYRNVIRDFRDLIWQPDQIDTLLDRMAEWIGPFVPADRDRWRSAPSPSGNENTGPIEPKVADMKVYAWTGGVNWPGEGDAPRPNGTAVHLDGLQADAAIPDTPTITYTGDPGFPVNVLSFQCSNFSDPQGNNTFDAMEWRIGQIFDTNAPNHNPNKLMIFEYDLIWGSGTVSNFSNQISIPSGATQVGLTFRARVRFRDNTDRWSHWSAPVEFTTTVPSNLAALTNNLRVTEVMYHAPQGSAYDFIEFFNMSSSFPLVLDGVMITEGIDYTFPVGTVLSQGQYLVVAKLPGPAFDAYYGTAGTTVLGPYAGNFNNDGEDIRVEPPGGGEPFIDLEYSDGRGWPLEADGAGHALIPLVNDRQDDCMAHPVNWRASAYIAGSPGGADPDPPTSVVINEFAAHTDFSDTNYPAYDSDDWIELYNPEPAFVNLTNHYLSDEAGFLKKWEIPAQLLGAGNWVSFNEVFDFHNPITNGFGLNKAGEQIYLSYLPGTPADRVVDSIKFKAQENGRTLGRYRDGEAYWYDMPPTRAQANRLDGPPAVVIRELMFAPAGTNLLEYVELYNPGLSPVPLWNASGVWRMNGGIDFDFPPNTTIGAEAYLILVPFSPTNAADLNLFLTTYGLTNGQVNLVGPYSGKLSDLGERIALEKPQAPDFPDTEIDWVIVDEVYYYRKGTWPLNTTGTGYSLHRIFDEVSGHRAANWLGMLASPGLGPVVLRGMRLDASTWRLLWAVSPGRTYVLESSTDLYSGVWTTVTTVTGNGQVTFDDIPIPDGRRYYRIRVVE